MAANYWTSTQRRYWHFSRETLCDIREQLESSEVNIIQQYPLPDRRLLSLFFNQRMLLSLLGRDGAHSCMSEITKLAKRMQIRQQAIATAQVYMRRFYIKVQVRQTNPYIVMATALYLACKMEECPQHIRIVLGEARAIWSGSKLTDIFRTILG